jgi:hypothetical protein
MKDQKRKESVSKALYQSYRKALHIQFGKVNGDYIYEVFEKRFNELLFDRSVYTNAALNRHLTKNILPGITL